MSDSLPTRLQLLQACRGYVTNHPLLRAARELTMLHERRLGAAPGITTDIDEDRARLVREIGRWAEIHLPPAHDAVYLHTETLGAVLDRLAQFTACAYAALAADDQWDLWHAWDRLAELAVAYEDLATELTAGRRRLPGTP
ncbi:DUF4254 domain-containing protein [Nocardia sp. CA-129566]|uniref:DUF4254 domain-containing protein n=1 Tax=Nocardia sp. CA-129566 TaxID=3239976 RepID=UPI003D97A4D7